MSLFRRYRFSGWVKFLPKNPLFTSQHPVWSVTMNPIRGEHKRTSATLVKFNFWVSTQNKKKIPSSLSAPDQHPKSAFCLPRSRHCVPLCPFCRARIKHHQDPGHWRDELKFIFPPRFDFTAVETTHTHTHTNHRFTFCTLRALVEKKHTLCMHGRFRRIPSIKRGWKNWVSNRCLAKR